MDSEEIRSILSRSRVGIWALIEAAIGVASSDYGEELRRRRDRIVESLYVPPAQLCRNCNGGMQDDDDRDGVFIIISPLTPESNHRNFSGGEEEEEDVDPYAGLFDDEQTKILNIKEQLEDPQQSEDAVVELLQTLADMDITFLALKETDIGRHVNRLRKHPSNEVRRLVKQLVRKWKELWANGLSHHQVPDFGYSPNPRNGNSGAKRNHVEHETKPKALQSAPRREAPSRPPQSAPKSASAPPPNREQREPVVDDERLNSARRRLQENYQEAENAKRQRMIQVMDIHELPKPKNAFFAKNKSGFQGRHHRHWALITTLGASRRRFAIIRTRLDRRPPPIASSRRPESIEPSLNNFHQLFEEIPKIAPQLFTVGRAALSPPSNGADSNESPTNSIESTQPSLPVQQKQQQNFSTKKSFAEILTGSYKQRYDELQKFFLADSTPTMVGTRVDIDGRPTLIFNDMETLSFAAAFRYALVGKFSHGAPQYRNLHRLIAGLGIKGAFTISMINAKHDLSHLWLRRIWHVQGFPMRVFKWIPTFTPEQESSIVPVWIDDFTFNQSKLSKARVGIEINLTKPLVEEFDLKINGITIRQKVECEQVPKCCNLCKHVGHDNLECYSKGNAPRAPQRKWKQAVKHSKFKEKMTTDECVFMEKGECAKSAEDCHRYISEGVLNSQKETGEVCNDEVEINHDENDDFVAENDAFAVENENSVAENDSIRVIENVVELDGNGNDRNDTLDGETIDVTCGDGPVGDCNNMDATKGMEIQLFFKQLNQSLLRGGERV
ncbi:putative mediator of RNA polymerase II transcription subunitc [Sesamum angolense]|uniref:Mediator of RNA polymerase II transcription subunitc n=1 Tax=Sesamum angolense TaxID=2727404 RepID=A0AAE1T6D5_9LAMI|nr:putative mediator of RNA polymerase II transcription subunitc [Sesamum angolense]